MHRVSSSSALFNLIYQTVFRRGNVSLPSSILHGIHEFSVENFEERSIPGCGAKSRESPDTNFAGPRHRR